jgi:hypothetical protein
MSRSGLGRSYLFFVAYCLIVALTLGAFASRAQQSADINDALAKLAGFKPKNTQIAPMIKKGVAVPGDWTSANPVTFSDGTTAGSLWGYITHRIGFFSGGETPEQLQNGPGFLALIKDSEVILSGGTRSTFGWFVKMEGDNGESKDFFILMSYDLRPNFSGPSRAFEVFVFTAGHSIYDNTQLSTLVGGYAVQFDGTLLNEVPLTIADQRFNQNPGVAVTPGVVNEGKGCLACHSHNLDDLPQATGPFPWTGNFYPTTTSLTPETPPVTSTSNSTSSSTTTPQPNSPTETPSSSGTSTSVAPPVIVVPVIPSTSVKTDTPDTDRTDRDSATASPSTAPKKQDASTESTTAKPDQPKSSATTPNETQKRNSAVDRTTVKEDQPKSSSIAPKGERETSKLNSDKAAPGTKSAVGEKPASGKASKSASRTASGSKPAKKQEDKTEVHIEFFSSKSGGGSFNSGGFNGGGYGR